MPIQKIEFRPGIVRELTQYANSGGWWDADKVRFRAGYPEKIGGWQAVTRAPFAGVCRSLHQWSSVEYDRYVGMGTSTKLYILWGNSYYDITPIRATLTLPTDPISTYSVGSTTQETFFEVTTNTPGHGMTQPGDTVTLSGVSTPVDVFPASDFNTSFVVTAVISPTQFIIALPGQASAYGVKGGGSAVKATFQIPTGLENAVVGTGWGIPPWGGSSNLLPSKAVALNGLATYASPDLLKVNAPAHGFTNADSVAITGMTGTVDVFLPADINNVQMTVQQVIDADNFTVAVPGTKVMSATGIAGGGSGMSVNEWTGWGMSFDPRLLSPVGYDVNQIRLWDMDNFGEDLVANIRNGPIYYWHQQLGVGTPASPLNQTITVGGVVFTPNQVPNYAAQVLVSPNDRHLIAFGCDDVGQTLPDPLLVRWSNEEDAYDWEPRRDNSAGGQRLSLGSYIISALRTRQEILIWTDLGLWSMRYIGAPYIFGFDTVAEGLSIIGPNASVNAGNMLFWMDRGIFYAYTGQVQELPCTIKDYVFSDLNYTQEYKICTGHNHSFSEVIWFYCSSESSEIDKYIIYNYVDQNWSIGNLERTAWLDMGRSAYPIAASPVTNLLYYHELGTDNDGSPLPAYVESSDMDQGGGDHFLFLGRMLPDVQFRGSSNSQSVGISVLTRNAALGTKDVGARFTVTPVTEQNWIRVRARQISFRIESSDVGVGWRLGNLRADMQVDGKR